ncbi:MAG TPA: hypothetical protein VLB90_09660 [Pseudomonadales bacterium]|nr:hypothetical protein [Pseudomonadales bacterium]
MGIDEAMLEAYWQSPERSLPADIIQCVDLLSRLAIALRIMLSNNTQQEVSWLEGNNQANAPLLELLNNLSPLEFISDKGIAGLEILCSYLEEKAARVQNNERYLLCLGACNTLFDAPYVHADMVVALALQGVENPAERWQANIVAARELPSAIPIGKRHVLLPRPHLQELIEYIQQHPNLDVAIISGSSREYIDKFVPMVAPELLKMCQFIWSHEDLAFYHKRAGGENFKTLEHIPELVGYKSGKILMVEHAEVFPRASCLSVKPFYGDCFTAAELENEHDLQDIIRRLAILTQVDDIIALRKEEDAEFVAYAEKVTAWANQHKISMFDADYSEKMAACPFKAPVDIDDIEVPDSEGQSIEFDIE